MFWEVARAMMEYGFVHPRPPAIPKYRARFVIVAYEGLWVDEKKSWAGISQWLTVLVPPILPIKQKKRGR